MIGLDDLLEKTLSLRADAVRVVLLHQLPEGLANPTCALGARDSQHHIVTLLSHKADSDTHKADRAARAQQYPETAHLVDLDRMSPRSGLGNFGQGNGLTSGYSRGTAGQECGTEHRLLRTHAPEGTINLVTERFYVLPWIPLGHMLGPSFFIPGVWTA